MPRYYAAQHTSVTLHFSYVRSGLESKIHCKKKAVKRQGLGLLREAEVLFT